MQPTATFTSWPFWFKFLLLANKYFPVARELDVKFDLHANWGFFRGCTDFLLKGAFIIIIILPVVFGGKLSSFTGLSLLNILRTVKFSASHYTHHRSLLWLPQHRRRHHLGNMMARQEDIPITTLGSILSFPCNLITWILILFVLIRCDKGGTWSRQTHIPRRCLWWWMLARRTGMTRSEGLTYLVSHPATTIHFILIGKGEEEYTRTSKSVIDSASHRDASLVTY